MLEREKYPNVKFFFFLHWDILINLIFSKKLSRKIQTWLHLIFIVFIRIFNKKSNDNYKQTHL